jgi:hypothetical protein
LGGLAGSRRGLFARSAGDAARSGNVPMLRTVVTAAGSGDIRRSLGNDIDLRRGIGRRRGAERGRELLHGIAGRWNDHLRPGVVELRGHLRDHDGRRVVLRPRLRTWKHSGSEQSARYERQHAGSAVGHHEPSIRSWPHEFRLRICLCRPGGEARVYPSLTANLLPFVQG